MNSVIHVPFEPIHWDLLQPDPRLAGLKASLNVDAVMNLGQGVTWIDRERGEVLAMTGYIQRVPGVAWMWFIPSERGSHMLIRFLRHFRWWVSTLEPGIRLEAHVLATFNEGIRWAELLGMTRENAEPIEKWDGQDDYHLYAKIIGEDDGPENA